MLYYNINPIQCNTMVYIYINAMMIEVITQTNNTLIIKPFARLRDRVRYYEIVSGEALVT